MNTCNDWGKFPLPLSIHIFICMYVCIHNMFTYFFLFHWKHNALDNAIENMWCFNLNLTFINASYLDLVDNFKHIPTWTHITNIINKIFLPWPRVIIYYIRGKSLLELWVTTFLHDWQPPLIFVRFISNFLCMYSNSMASAHVILK